MCRPGGIPARNSKGERLLLYLGIIDILQSFRLKKRLEHTMKAMVIDGVSLPFCSTHLLDILKLLDEKQNQTNAVMCSQPLGEKVGLEESGTASAV